MAKSNKKIPIPKSSKQIPISKSSKSINPILQSPSLRSFNLQSLKTNLQLQSLPVYRQFLSNLEDFNTKIKNSDVHLQLEVQLNKYIYHALLQCNLKSFREAEQYLQKINKWHNEIRAKEESKVQLPKADIKSKQIQRVRKTYKSLLPLQYFEQTKNRNIQFVSKHQRYLIQKTNIDHKGSLFQIDSLPNIEPKSTHRLNNNHTLSHESPRIAQKHNSTNISWDNISQRLYRNQLTKLSMQREQKQLQQHFNELKKRRANRAEMLVRSLNTSLHLQQEKAMGVVDKKRDMILKRSRRKGGDNTQKFTRKDNKENSQIENIDGLLLIKLAKKLQQ